MSTFRRVHDNGTEAVLRQDPDAWRIRFDLREANHLPATVVGFFAPTLEAAKQIADKEILKHGHVCNGTCKGWVQC